MKAATILLLVFNAVSVLASPQVPVVADGVYQTRYEGRPSMSYVSGHWANAKSVLGSPSAMLVERINREGTNLIDMLKADDFEIDCRWKQ
jgi:isoleucyl-tRNA synthetase